jgi:hypothetical protein
MGVISRDGKKVTKAGHSELSYRLEERGRAADPRPWSGV